MDNILNTITAYREERKWSLYGSKSTPVVLTPQQMQVIDRWSVLRPDQQEAFLNLLNTIP